MRQLIKNTILICLISIPLFAQSQTCEVLDRVQLKQMLNELGYTVKDVVTTPGKEKYQVDFNKDGLNIPVGYEISPSTNYIWLTVNLGKALGDTSRNHFNLLRQNGKIQPCQFYITESGTLMLGLAIENRGVTNAILRRHSENVSSRVSETKLYWELKK